jgi:hypothetical protein
MGSVPYLKPPAYVMTFVCFVQFLSEETKEVCCDNQRNVNKLRAAALS